MTDVALIQCVQAKETESSRIILIFPVKLMGTRNSLPLLLVSTNDNDRAKTIKMQEKKQTKFERANCTQQWPAQCPPRCGALQYMQTDTEHIRAIAVCRWNGRPNRNDYVSVKKRLARRFPFLFGSSYFCEREMTTNDRDSWRIEIEKIFGCHQLRY